MMVHEKGLFVHGRAIWGSQTLRSSVFSRSNMLVFQLTVPRRVTYHLQVSKTALSNSHFASLRFSFDSAGLEDCTLSHNRVFHVVTVSIKIPYSNLAIFVIDITVSVKILCSTVLVRFSRTATLPCVVVTGPLFSLATHVGWSVPCRFDYKVITRGHNTQGLIPTLRRRRPLQRPTLCQHPAYPTGLHALWDFIITIVYLTFCICWLKAIIPGALMSSMVLHGVPSAPYRRTCLAAIMLQSNCAFRFLWLSGRLLIGSRPHPGFQLMLLPVLHESSCYVFQVCKYPQGL